MVITLHQVSIRQYKFIAMEGQAAQPTSSAALAANATGTPGETDVSLGKAFYARTVGIGPAFVESLDHGDNSDSVVTTLRKRAGCVCPRGAVQRAARMRVACSCVS